MARVHLTLADRFWAKVLKTEGCWLWTGAKGSNGYGKIHVTDPGGQRGRDGRAPRKMLWVHRVAWEIARGPIPEGIEILHNCPGGDNHSCVNPSHLMLGTHADNMQDAGNKGQMQHGSSHCRAKLTEDLVRVLRARYAAGGVTQQSLADEVGVGTNAMNWALRGKAWKHVR